MSKSYSKAMRLSSRPYQKVDDGAPAHAAAPAPAAAERKTVNQVKITGQTFMQRLRGEGFKSMLIGLPWPLLVASLSLYYVRQLWRMP